MLYGFLVTLYTIIALLCILFVLIQKGKGNMGMGAFGGGSQMLFGGAGGQDILQKITWVLTVLLMCGSLVISLMRTQLNSSSRYLSSPAPAQHAPITPPSSIPSQDTTVPQATDESH
jgi:preprotein translocase subunit SecG